MPFDDDFDSSKAKSGVKIKNDNSTVKAPVNTKGNFEKRVDTLVGRENEYKKRAMELGKRLMGLMHDQTLVENKTPTQKSLEQETMTQLVNLVQEMEGDEDLPNGVGLAGAATLILKTLFHQRDRINELEFKLHKMNKPQQ